MYHIAYHIVSYHISYHIISYIMSCHTSYHVSYHISYHIISYNIISYNIISYHISYHIIPYNIINFFTCTATRPSAATVWKLTTLRKLDPETMDSIQYVSGVLRSLNVVQKLHPLLCKLIVWRCKPKQSSSPAQVRILNGPQDFLLSAMYSAVRFLTSSVWLPKQSSG